MEKKMGKWKGEGSKKLNKFHCRATSHELWGYYSSDYSWADLRPEVALDVLQTSPNSRVGSTVKNARDSQIICGRNLEYKYCPRVWRSIILANLLSQFYLLYSLRRKFTAQKSWYWPKQSVQNANEIMKCNLVPIQMRDPTLFKHRGGRKKQKKQILSLKQQSRKGESDRTKKMPPRTWFLFNQTRWLLDVSAKTQDSRQLWKNGECHRFPWEPLVAFQMPALPASMPVN